MDDLERRLSRIENYAYNAKERAGYKGHFFVLLLLVIILSVLCDLNDKVNAIEHQLSQQTEVDK